jgi:hypothetical protein
MGSMVKLVNTLISKINDLDLTSSSLVTAIFFLYSFIKKWVHSSMVEQWPFKPVVIGSIPIVLSF